MCKTVLRPWRFRNLTLEGRLIVFKSFAISKIVFQALIATVPSHTIKALETIQISFFYGITLIPKIREAVCQNFREGGLQKVGIRNKSTSRQITWVKRLYDDFFHEWKIIPLYLLKKTFGPSLFKFQSNLSFNKSSLKKLLPFCR